MLRFLLDICTRKEIPVSAPLTVPRLLDKLASALLEPNLVQPTFLINHPMIMSPLSKPSPGNPDIAERFELYAGGMELCNAYTELNDPEIQRKTLLTQVFNNFNNFHLNVDFLGYSNYGLQFYLNS